MGILDDTFSLLDQANRAGHPRGGPSVMGNYNGGAPVQPPPPADPSISNAPPATFTKAQPTAYPAQPPAEPQPSVARAPYGGSGGWADAAPAPSGGSGGWSDAVPTPNGMTSTLARPEQSVYDPDAGAIVPVADVNGAIRRGANAVGGAANAVGGVIQNTFNAMGANTGTGFVPPSAVHPSAQVVRPPAGADQYPDQNSRMGTNYANSALGSQGPNGNTGRGMLARAADEGPIQNYFQGLPIENNPQPNAPRDVKMELAQFDLNKAARDAQDLRGIQERNRGQIAQANAADMSQQAERAAGDARVANFRASNGADMVLAAGNPAYAGQRRSIMDQAVAANVRSGVAQDGSNKANAELGKTGNPIDDFAKDQEALTKGRLGLSTEKGTEIDNQVKTSRLAGEKAITAMMDQLQKATDPKEIATLQRKIAAAHGKPVDKVAIVDHDTGQVSTDALGHVTPIYKKVAIDLQTGEVLGQNGQQKAAGAGKPPSAESVAYLKAHPEAKAEFEAHFGLPPGGSAAYLK